MKPYPIRFIGALFSGKIQSRNSGPRKSGKAPLARYALMLFGVSFSYIFIASCVPSATFGPGEFSQYLRGARLEPEGVHNSGLVPSDIFWLTSGERLYATWEDYVIEFPPGTYADNKIICKFCGEYPWCRDENGVAAKRQPSLAGPKVFIRRRDSQGFTPVMHERTLCDPQVFEATDAGTYELGTTVASLDEDPNIAFKADTALTIRLINRGDVQKLPPFRLDAVDETTWQWTVGGGGKWAVNFSNRLRVTKVRVLRGRMIGEELVPTDMAKPFVTPYQIRLAYPENGGLAREIQSCPGSSIDVTGYLNLADCQTIIGGPGGIPEFPTPTHTHDLPQDRLTWKVIFNASEGFPPPDLAPDEILAIEFNLEAM